MSRTYTATGINLKSMPLGEYDRLLTILTAEHGLLRAVAPGARKHKSKLGGRSALFVVNQLQIAAGRTLPKVIQAETLMSYPRLSQDLCKLTASQYLAELALCQALSQQPQAELFHLLTEHLGRIEQLPKVPQDRAVAAAIAQHSQREIELQVLSHLAHATFHLLALAGIAPQVQICCLTQQPLVPDFGHPPGAVGFSVAAGGTISPSALARLADPQPIRPTVPSASTVIPSGSPPAAPFAPGLAPEEAAIRYKPPAPAPEPFPYPTRVAEPRHSPYHTATRPEALPPIQGTLSALELALLQHLAQPHLLDLAQQATIAPQGSSPVELQQAWLAIERLLRQYSQYHFERPIRAAALIDTCFIALSSSVRANRNAAI